MRIAIIACTLAWTSAGFAQTAEAETKNRQLSALVEASRKAKSEVKPKPVARITNANLKTAAPKKKGPASEPAPAAATAHVEVVAPTVEAEAAAVSAAEKRVKDLEKELLRLEQAYYDETDPSYRERVVRPRFEGTKKLLDDARAALGSKRAEVKESETPPGTE